MGIATQAPGRAQGVVVKDKRHRVAEFHRATIHAFWELLGGAGLESPREIQPTQVLRRIAPITITINSFDVLYPQIPEGSLHVGEIPTGWEQSWSSADATSW